MSVYRFSEFEFDEERLRLSYQGELTPLRHKTALLLKLLLGERGGVLSKQQIIDQVWQRQMVSDQSVFQAISELRQRLAPAGDLIATHPGIGYEWISPVACDLVDTTPVAAASWRLAAGILVMLLAAPVIRGDSTHHRLSNAAADISSQLPATPPIGIGSAAVGVLDSTRLVMPAMRAFAQGLDHLGAGRAREAERLFLVAAQENPAFAEASLMIGESLLAQQRYTEASAQATALLGGSGEVPSAQSAYISVAAMDLLSRISEQAGQPYQAIAWSATALAQAREHAFVCTAAASSDRLAQLVRDGSADQAPTGEEPLQSDRVPAHLQDQASDALSAAAIISEHAPSRAHCEEIGALPGESVPGIRVAARAVLMRRCVRPVGLV